MPFQLLNGFLTYLSIHISYTLLLYQIILKPFLIRTLTAWFCSRIILVAPSSLLTYWLTKSWNISRLILSFQANLHKSLVKKKNATLLFTNGRLYFQVSEYKGRNFLDLNDDNNQPIYPIYTRGSAWIKYFSLSNSMCIYITRLIMNYAPIGKYRLPFAYPCKDYPIEKRKHILFVSRLLIVDFIFIFSSHFILFFFFLFFSFLFLEQLRLGFISHTVTSITGWWRSYKTDHRTWKNGVEGSGMKWHHITWTTHGH